MFPKKSVYFLFESSYLLITSSPCLRQSFPSFSFSFSLFFSLVLGHAAGSESVKSQLLASPLVVPSFKHFSVQRLSLPFIFAGRYPEKSSPHKQLWPKKITNALYPIGSPINSPAWSLFRPGYSAARAYKYYTLSGRQTRKEKIVVHNSHVIPSPTLRINIHCYNLT